MFITICDPVGNPNQSFEQNFIDLNQVLTRTRRKSIFMQDYPPFVTIKTILDEIFCDWRDQFPEIPFDSPQEVLDWVTVRNGQVPTSRENSIAIEGDEQRVGLVIYHEELSALLEYDFGLLVE